MASAADEWKEKGNAAFQAEDFQKAVDYYTNGVELEPRNRALFSNRSAAYLKIEDYAKAKLDARICIDLDKSWPKGWWRLGKAQMEDKDYEAARKTFEEGLKFCHNDSNLLQGLKDAQARIDVLSKVQGGGGEPFNPDGPSQKDKGAGASGTDAGANSAAPKAADGAEFPKSAEEEIARIKNAPNHYAVLHVSPDASNAKLKKNYYALARMLHPDKCQLPGAEDAMTSVSLAYDTLTNVIKKTLYDQYMQQTSEGVEENGGKDQTYAEWEASQQPMELPKWLSVLLGIKGCGWILAFLITILFLPIILLVVVIFIIMWIILLPYRLTLRFCFPEKYEQMKEEREKELAKMEEDAQDRMFAHV